MLHRSQRLQPDAHKEPANRQGEDERRQSDERLDDDQSVLRLVDVVQRQSDHEHASVVEARDPHTQLAAARGCLDREELHRIALRDILRRPCQPGEIGEVGQQRLVPRLLRWKGEHHITVRVLQCHEGAGRGFLDGAFDVGSLGHEELLDGLVGALQHVVHLANL